MIIREGSMQHIDHIDHMCNSIKNQVIKFLENLEIFGNLHGTSG